MLTTPASFHHHCGSTLASGQRLSPIIGRWPQEGKRGIARSGPDHETSCSMHRLSLEPGALKPFVTSVQRCTEKSYRLVLICGWTPYIEHNCNTEGSLKNDNWALWGTKLLYSYARGSKLRWQRHFAAVGHLLNGRHKVILNHGNQNELHKRQLSQIGHRSALIISKRFYIRMIDTLCSIWTPIKGSIYSNFEPQEPRGAWEMTTVPHGARSCCKNMQEVICKR